MARRRPGSFVALEDLGRVRLSRHFFFRDFLYSEIAAMHLRPNLPDDPDLAIAAGSRLATDLLDPLVETFGPIHVRSAFRSAELNAFGAGLRPQKCSANAKNLASHIWDRRDAAGRMGATACVVVPWFADQPGRDWRDLAWWVHDHLPYHAMQVFPRLTAFNLTWREAPERTISSYVPPRGLLLRPGAAPDEDRATRARRYADFPPCRGLRYPEPPGQPRPI